MRPSRSISGVTTLLCLALGPVFLAGGLAESEEHWFLVRHEDYFRQKLLFDWPTQVSDSSLEARLTVVQPHGFSHELTAVATREKDTGALEVDFPLLDEGRYGPLPEWRWDMGHYRFRLDLSSEGRSVGVRTLQLDPHNFFPLNAGRPLSLADSSRQFIECSPERPAYIDHPEIGYTIRTLPDRVNSCRVEIDVQGPDRTRMAGPVRLDLDHATQRRNFDGTGWPRGEYWLRVRVLKNEKAVGPYLVRHFWVEDSQEAQSPRLPLRPGHHAQYLLDNWILADSKGLRHRPDGLSRLSDGPVLRLDKPWEEGSYVVSLESISRDPDTGQYQATYFAGVVDEDPLYRRFGGSVGRPRYLCQVVSDDGVHWRKPNLGRVSYEGSRDNNILRDLTREDFLQDGQSDSYPYPNKDRPTPRRYRFRFYEPRQDGPVDMDRFVLRYFSRKADDSPAQYAGDFRPRPGEFWGLERRGDLFLALTREPILRTGTGMSLMVTTERASTYPFEGEPLALYQSARSTFTHYDPRSKTFFYYFRPEYPPYPPHGVSYEYFKKSARRTRGLLWSRDGRSWNRRHIVAPDEHDLPGTSFYGFGFIHPAGHVESDTGGQLFLGAVLHYNLTLQTQFQELVWSRDKIHWRRFGAGRTPLLENGPVGAFDAGFANNMSAYFSIPGAQGEEEWWFPYMGNQARYMLAAARDTVKKLRVSLRDVGLEMFRETYPHFRLAPFFTNWEDFFKESQASVWIPGLARCKAGRLGHVEPTDGTGEFTTHPLVQEGNRLLINARIEDGGSVRVEVQDADGNVFPGLELEGSTPLSGDSVAHPVPWKRAGLKEVYGRVIRLRVVLDRAHVYGFRLAP